MKTPSRASFSLSASRGPASGAAGEIPQRHQQDGDQLKAHAPRHQMIAAAGTRRRFRLIAAHRQDSHEQNHQGRQSGNNHENEENICKRHLRLNVDARVDAFELVSRLFFSNSSRAQGDAVSHSRVMIRRRRRGVVNPVFTRSRK